MKSESDQARRALEQANAVRMRRRELLDPLRRGDVLFDELDLDDPVIESMTVYALLRCVRINRRPAGKRATTSGGTVWAARRVLRAFECGPMVRVAELSPARRGRLRELVAAMLPAQRPQ
jgi:hypothetical protein